MQGWGYYIESDCGMGSCSGMRLGNSTGNGLWIDGGYILKNGKHFFLRTKYSVGSGRLYCQRWSHHFPSYILFCNVLLPLPHQELVSGLYCFISGFSLWLLLFREHGRTDAVKALGIALKWPVNFGFPLLESQLLYKTMILWESKLLHEVALEDEKSQDEIGGGGGMVLWKWGERPNSTKASDMKLKKPFWII